MELPSGARFCMSCGQPLAAAYSSVPNSGTSQYDAEKLARAVLPACVVVRSSTGSSGSGFFCGDPPVIVTNFHVVDGASEVVVQLPSGREFPVEEVVSGSRTDDVAILRVRLPAGADPKALTLANEKSVVVGQAILVAGHPDMLEQSVSTGIVSALRLGRNLIQITAPISRGSSGGPVVDRDGHVIGVASGSFNDKPGYQNLNFAVPCDVVRRHMAALVVSWRASQSLALKSGGVTCLAASPSGDVLCAGTSEGRIVKASVDSARVLRVADRRRRILSLDMQTDRSLISVEISHGTVGELRWMNDRISAEHAFGITSDAEADAGCISMTRTSEGAAALHVLGLWRRERGATVDTFVSGPGANEDVVKQVDSYVSKKRITGVHCSEGHWGTSLVVACTGDGSAMFLKLSTGELLREIRATSPLTAATFRRDGMGVLLGDRAGQLWTWDVFDVRSSDLAPQKIANCGAAVTAIAISPDGELLLAGTVAGDVHLFRAERKTHEPQRPGP